MKLMDFEQLSERAVEWNLSRDRALRGFLGHPLVVRLGWPDDVIEQWLFDHAGHGAFHVDYGHINLNEITWTLERLDTSLLRLS